MDHLPDTAMGLVAYCEQHAKFQGSQSPLFSMLFLFYLYLSSIYVRPLVEKVKITLTRHELENGEWKDWDGFKKDMKAKYTSTDSGFARYLKLKQIVQKDGETVESYYQRFDENIDRQKEDETTTDGDDHSNDNGNGHKGINNQYNYMFVDNLHRSIKPGFFRLPEARGRFQKKDLYELRELATRVEESVSHFQAGYLGTAKSTSKLNSHSNSNNKSSKKFRKNRDTDEISREKLRSTERSFLTSDIAKGGGTYIYPYVQKKLEWIKWARKEKLCVKCASKSHSGENSSPIAKDAGKGSDSRNGGKNSLHAVIMAMEAEEAGRREMNPDGQYLCSVQDSTRKDLILLMYDCEVNKLKGIALGDPGATMTYISNDYARRSNVRFHEKSTS
jgi:hypothetical protein